LFRDGIENLFRASDLVAAARHTLDSTLLMGFDVLCTDNAPSSTAPATFS